MKKIKLFIESEKGKDILTVLIVILVGLGSFELGRLSKENNTNGLKIEYNGQEANLIAPTTDKSSNNSDTTKSSQNSNLGEYFASNRGKKYYSINCSAGKTIKQENRIYFSTAIEAEKAGYQLSSSCE
jgi:hypothetical protein